MQATFDDRYFEHTGGGRRVPVEAGQQQCGFLVGKECKEGERTKVASQLSSVEISNRKTLKTNEKNSILQT